MTTTQALVLRLGAVACLLGAVVMTVAALTVDSGSPAAGEVTVADDPTEITLPDPGLFGSEVVVYGGSGDTGVAPSDLGCRLLSRTGREQGVAKMSELAVISTPSVTVADQRLDALFTVDSYPAGSVLACSDAQQVAPLALSEPSTFGRAGAVVRVTAALGAVTFLVVGLVGLLITRSGSARRRPASPG
jgi:hypothetical protein